MKTLKAFVRPVPLFWLGALSLSFGLWWLAASVLGGLF
jgi:hypothetical protein